MKIYNYNQNGEFVGESLADESPLEPSVFLIPAHATDIEPPTYNEGFIPVWNGASWDIKDISLELPPANNETPQENKNAFQILQEENEKLKSRVSATEDAILFFMG